MNWKKATVCTLKSRRLWLWELAGIIIYGIPVIIRFATNNIIIPWLNFPGHWIGFYIPGNLFIGQMAVPSLFYAGFWTLPILFYISGNLLEKILVNAFFPGGAGAVLGEVFIRNLKGEVSRKTVYAWRLVGAMFQVSVWTVFQFWGYSLLLKPLGFNLFESVLLIPLNFTIATLSIFTPTIVGFVWVNIKKVKAKTTA
jgi:hypothetical protein